MELEQLKSILESLLFVSGEPIKISKLSKIAEAPKPEAENALMILAGEYESGKRGLAIIRKEDEVQMVSNPDNANFAKLLVESELQESLSNAALEVISIIAYRGPVTRAQIESIRGVNSSFTLRNLLIRGLIDRIENPKDARGYIYSVSFDFLKHLGLDSINKLPDYESLSKDSRIDSVLNNS